MPSSAQYFPDLRSLKKDKGINLEIYQCSRCELVQLNNKPVSYYKEVIRSSDVSKAMKLFREKQFKEIIKRFKLTNKKIIEIGCGSGEYLSIIKKFNVKSFGIEYGINSFRNCLKRKLNVSKSYLENPKFVIKNSPFDAFFIFSFLEHLPNINSVLKSIHNNLDDDGVGIIEVPNFDMILKKDLFSEFIRDHLFYFTKDTLERTLNFNGFKVVKSSTVWQDYIISSVVKKSSVKKIFFNKNFKRLNLKHFYKQQLNIKKQIEKFINKSKLKKIAVWGAGHQALTLISQTKISKKILFIVDSANFKQNKYSPASQIPIYSPIKLEKKEVDSILILAASYSDEVVKIILKKFKNTFRIAILRDSKLEKINFKKRL